MKQQGSMKDGRIQRLCTSGPMMKYRKLTDYKNKTRTLNVTRPLKCKKKYYCRHEKLMSLVN